MSEVQPEEASVIRVALPWPPRELSPNSRCHWAVKAKAAKKYKADAWALTLHATPVYLPHTGPVQVSMTFHPPDERRRDWVNMLSSTKNGIDGIAQALGIDDSRFQLGMMVGVP